MKIPGEKIEVIVNTKHKLLETKDKCYWWQMIQL